MVESVAGRRKRDLNVLWDSASDLFFITFRKAHELGLTGQRITLEVTKVGAEKEIISSYKYKLVLHVWSKSMISIRFLLIELQSIEKGFQCPPQTLQRPNSGEIDCLIGFNYAAFHPRKSKEVGHLLLLQNRFGFLVELLVSKLTRRHLYKRLSKRCLQQFLTISFQLKAWESPVLLNVAHADVVTVILVESQ